VRNSAKAGGVYTLWAEVLREWNRLDEALELLEKSRSLAVTVTAQIREILSGQCSFRYHKKLL
jgi:hypothetical protein